MQPTTLQTTRTMRQWIGLGVIALVLFIILGVGFFIWYNATHLLVASTRPTGGSTATGATDVVFWFNRPISSDTAKNFSISPKVSGKTVVRDNSITFSPDKVFTDGKTYTATISHAKSADGRFSSGAVKLSFKIGYVPYDQQPKAVQKRGLKLTDDRPPGLGYFGADDLTNQGVTSAQLVNIEAFLKTVHDTTPQTDDAINIFDVTSQPFDSNSDNPKQTYNFNVQVNDSTYKAVLDCFILGDSQLRLYDSSGNLVKDSGVMKSDNSADDSDLVN